MPNIRALVTIPAANGVPEDAVTNSWHFTCPEGEEADAAAQISPNLEAFYEDWASFRSLLQNWAGTTIRYYNMSDTKPRAPFYTSSGLFSATAAASALPAECTLCLSFQAVPTSGAIQARRRGRVYLGTFGSVASDSSTGRPNSALILAVKNAANTFGAASSQSASPGQYVWVVYSMTTGAVPGTHTEAGTGYTVSGGWVDNAWDTQRRRGPRMTSKLTFSF